MDYSRRDKLKGGKLKFSFGDSHRTSAIHIAGVGDGGLRPPHRKATSPEKLPTLVICLANQRSVGLRLPRMMVGIDDSYASATHVAEVGNCGVWPPCPICYNFPK
jgi:hypothetical protein